MTELSRDPELDPAGDESTLLHSFLDYQRTILLRKAEGITGAQSRTRLEPSEMTLLGLIRQRGGERRLPLANRAGGPAQFFVFQQCRCLLHLLGRRRQ